MVRTGSRAACRAAGFEPDVRYISSEPGVVLSAVRCAGAVALLPGLGFPQPPQGVDALALAGAFAKQDVARGMWLVAAAGHRPLDRFQAELRIPAGQAELRHWTPVHLHLAAADIPARVSLLDCDAAAPGGRALAEIILERATLAAHGDRFVLRDAGARRTVAGGRELDCFSPARHTRAPDRLSSLAAMRDDDPAADAAPRPTSPAACSSARRTATSSAVSRFGTGSTSGSRPSAATSATPFAPASVGAGSRPGCRDSRRGWRARRGPIRGCRAG